ncbi:MAG TPA: hypothetical protein VF909_14285, partial [Roseiflexaceae bacterium]
MALLGRLPWERVDGFVTQASEKPAQKRTFQKSAGLSGPWISGQYRKSPNQLAGGGAGLPKKNLS